MASQLLGIKTRFTNDLGSPLVGGQVYTFFAGTSTAQDTYSDAALTVPNTNPVILDDTGSADIFLKGAYRIRVFDKSGRFIEEQDNVTQAASQGDATEINNKISSVESDLSATNTELGKVKFDTGITATAKFGGVERALSDKLKESVSIEDFYETSWSQALTSALSSSASTIIIPAGKSYTLTTGVVLEVSGKTLTGGGTLTVDAAISQLELLRLTGDNNSIIGIKIEGKNLLKNAVRMVGNNVSATHNTVTNLYADQSSAVAFYITSDGFYNVSDNYIKDMLTIGDATTGNGTGMARGVSISRANGIANAVGLVQRNYIENCFGEEGDAITVHSANYGEGNTVVSDNVILNWSRRAIKVQAFGVDVTNNRCVNIRDSDKTYNLNSTISMFVAGGCTVSNNTIRDFGGGVTTASILLSLTSDIEEVQEKYNSINISDNIISKLRQYDETSGIIVNVLNGRSIDIINNEISTERGYCIDVGGAITFLNISQNTTRAGYAPSVPTNVIHGTFGDRLHVMGNVHVNGIRSTVWDFTGTTTTTLFAIDNVCTVQLQSLFNIPAPNKRNIIKNNTAYVLLKSVYGRVNTYLGANTILGNDYCGELLYCDSIPSSSVRMATLDIREGQIVVNTSGGTPMFWIAASSGLGSAVTWTPANLTVV